MSFSSVYLAKVFYQPYVNEAPLLVPTLYSPTFRDTGKYASSEQLPDTDLRLARTLRQIVDAHELRGRKAKSFDSLWNKVCKKLVELKNAAAYEDWKRRKIIKNQSAYDDLNTKLAAAILNDSTQGSADSLQEELAKLKPKINASAEEALEIAIAYWIEAKNAKNESDELRTLNALIECHFYIGTTQSFKTESESKRDAGKKAGAVARDAMAEVVVEALKELITQGSLEDPDFIFGKVADSVAKNPDYASVLLSYDAQATNGKKTQDSTAERFADTVRDWATKKGSPYPEVVHQYRIACQQILTLGITKSQKSRR